MMKQRGLFILLMLLIVTCSVLVNAQESAYVPGANKERQVNLYATQSLTMTQAVVKVFERKYPFIKVEFVRAGAESMLSKIMAEKAAGKILFDVIYGGVAPLLTTLDVIQPYVSQETRVYPAQFKDPNGLWPGYGATYYVIGYNTRKVSSQEAPKVWEDLLDPKWRGRIGMDPDEFRWMGALEEYLGEERTKKIMAGLARQNIQWRRNHTALSQLMIAGEFDVALVFAASTEEMKEKGAPVEWIRNLKPIVVDIQAVALSAQLAHPNAAKLLYDFLISDEAAKVFLAQKRVPLRPGVIPSHSPLHPSGLELFPVPLKVQVNMKKYAAKFEQLFGTRE
jgi:iron(III) transport system substrate-binding protein